METTKELDEDMINDKIWPTSTYAMLALTIPVAVLSVKLPRHFLACGILCRLAAYLALLFSEETKVAPVIGVEVLYAAFLVIDSNVLVSTACLYASEDEFALAAVGIGIARELALVTSSLLGQALHDYTSYDITFLFVISLCSCLGAFAVFLGTLAATQVKDWKFMEDTATSRERKASTDSHASSINNSNSNDTFPTLKTAIKSALSLPLVLPASITLMYFYASFLISADYNFMLLTKDSDGSSSTKGLGLIEAGQDLSGALGSFLAGMYYEHRNRKCQRSESRSLSFLIALTILATACYAYSAIYANETYSILVVATIVPWGCYHATRTFSTCLITTALATIDGVNLLPLVLGCSGFLALVISSIVQMSVTLVEGSDERDFFTGCAGITGVGLLLLTSYMFYRKNKNSDKDKNKKEGNIFGK
ncbi:hypothetical protein TL16_g11546 [Triparma laevis f. inornata]|uniref:Uncharacterized protein n=1 Tax=Triparma laevis f. inornata TaxID=1714386 RepID=A0A9W7ETW9_9STRA|nr:hypothetical protein TL16_g11546 [Triparma laevis f. inornata]